MRLARQGEPQTQIARTLGMPRSTVRDIVNRGGTIRQGRPAGRPRLITPRGERLLARSAARDPFASASELSQQQFLNGTSPWTVRRTLRRKGLVCRVARRKPLLQKRAHRLARLQFALRYRNKPLGFWYRVLWSDESMLCSYRSEGRKCWRRVGAALHPQNVRWTVKFNGHRVMVWGCFSAAGVGPIRHIESTMDASLYVDILRSALPEARLKLKLPRGSWVMGLHARQ